MSVRFTFLTIGLAVATTCAFAARADTSNTLLGEIDFPNSGAKEAQSDFLEGVLYMHNFEYDEAAAAFQRAQEIDPDFAMAYWGEAMTYHHSLWNRQAADTARDTLRRLGKTPEARAAKAGTQREKDYLAAVEILYGTHGEAKKLPKEQRDVLYRDAMKRMHETYPDDHEAAVFYGLSILGVGSRDRDFATYMKAAAELTPVWDANRMHPGAAHYLIHSYDDPVHAPLGLPMARAYSKIAPAAAHAQHMTSHIFVSMGMWDDLVDANEIAVEIENEQLVGAGERPLTSAHYVYWLEYGYLQQGRPTDARALLEAAQARVQENPMARELAYYGTMYARYLFDTQDWDAADALAVTDDIKVSTPNYHFARAYAAAKRGSAEQARAQAENIAVGEGYREVIGTDASVEVMQKMILSVVAESEDDIDMALWHAEQARNAERDMAFNFGPPFVVKPSGELFGELLHSNGMHVEAVAAFQDQLTRTPGRTASLLGLARAAKAAGDNALSEETYQRLVGTWHTAEAGYAPLAEANAAI